MTWGIYKKTKELRGGGIGSLFSGLLNLIATPIRAIGGAIGNAIKPGAGDDFKKGMDMVLNPVNKFVNGLTGGGAPRQNYGSTLNRNRYIPRLDTSSDDDTSF